MAGKPWYNNGKNEIQIDVNKGEIIPDGYVRGRKPRTQQEKELTSNKRKQTFANKSQEEKYLINKKRSDSLKNHMQVNQKKKNNQSFKKEWKR